MIYDPHNWYWMSSDGRLFSSSRGSLVTETDDEFEGWLTLNSSPTRWPEDDNGLQTDEALQSALTPYGITFSATELGAYKARKISDLTNACAEEIVGGYKSDALGSSHTYPSKLVDQLNMMGSVTDAMTPAQLPGWSTPFWCADHAGEWSFRSHSASEILSAGQAGKAHIIECQTKLAYLSAQVEAALSKSAVDAIDWNM